jgi:hypothetical protein
LFPTRQTLYPGDWSTGMITTGLAPGQRFDLHISWVQGEATRQGVVEGLRCAENPSSDSPTSREAP